MEDMILDKIRFYLLMKILSMCKDKYFTKYVEFFEIFTNIHTNKYEALKG